MLLNKLQGESKIVLPDALECRVRYDQELSQKVSDLVVDYKAWHMYVTGELHVKAPKILITQILTLVALYFP